MNSHAEPEAPKPPSRLRIKRTDWTQETASPLCERYPEPKPGPPPRRWGAALLKGSAGLLLVAGLLTVSLFFIDIPTPVPSQPLQQAAHWLRSTGETSPTAPTLNSLYKVIRDVPLTADTRDFRCALIAVYGIGQLRIGNEPDAKAAGQYVRETCPDTDLVELVADKTLYQPCPECRGHVRTPCPSCRGTGKCTVCQGAGKVTAAPGSRQAKPALMQPEKKIQRLGESSGGGKPLGAASRACTACGRTGRCAACDGQGTQPTQCPTCAGSGRVVIPAAAAAQYAAAVRKAAVLGSRARTRSRVLGPLVKIQGVLRRRVPEARLLLEEEWNALMPEATEAQTDPAVEPTPGPDKSPDDTPPPQQESTPSPGH